MNTEHIYNILNTRHGEAEQRNKFGHFLREQITRREADPAHERQVAYDIAGMLSTQFAESLPEDDPYMEIMVIAGELEMDQANQGGATWEELAKRIRTLPGEEPPGTSA